MDEIESQLTNIILNHHADATPHRGVQIFIDIPNEINAGKYFDILRKLSRSLRSELVSFNLRTNWGHKIDVEVTFGHVHEDIHDMPEVRNDHLLRNRSHTEGKEASRLQGGTPAGDRGGDPGDQERGQNS